MAFAHMSNRAIKLVFPINREKEHVFHNTIRSVPVSLWQSELGALWSAEAGQSASPLAISSVAGSIGQRHRISNLLCGRVHRSANGDITLNVTCTACAFQSHMCTVCKFT